MKRRQLITTLASGLVILVVTVATVAIIRPASSSPGRGNANSTTTLSPSVTPLPLLPSLQVRDTQVYTAAGVPVTLVGASHSSLEYNCKGDGHFAPKDFAAMRAWGMTVVRLPLWSRFWLNLDGSCPTYQNTVAQVVANAEAAHLYVILDLQWTYAFPQPAYTDGNGNANYQYPMPDTGESVQFWQEVATRFKDDPGVIFDLYGEPNGITWQTWYAGGAITTPVGVFQAIGMRDLVAKVRSIAPATILIISGIDWGYDLADIGTTYTFPEKNLLFGTHPFDYGSKQPYDFQRAFGGLAAHHLAVIATEFGGYDCTTGYIASNIAYYNRHHIPWLVWTWAPYGCSTPSLLKDWNGTPSQPYGAYIQQAMQAMHATQ
jgi:endoglucanase